MTASNNSSDKILEGNALEALVVDHLGALRAFLATMGAHRDLIDDVAQDTFVEVIRCWDRYDRNSPFRAWLFGIARNLVRQEFRRGGVESRIRQGMATEVLIQQEEAAARDAESWDWDRAREELKKCLSLLSPRMARMLELQFCERKRTEEIAQELGQKGGTVRMSLMRARRQLKDCLHNRLRGAQA